MRFLGRYVPKKSDLVVFGAMNGLRYGDNSRYLFEWLVENRPDLRCVWITHSRDVHVELTGRGLPVRMSRSIAGIFTIFRAAVGVYTNSLSDLTAVPEFVPKSLPLIALRHGQAVKASRFAMLKLGLSRDEERLRRREAELIRYAISTSDLISEMQEKVLRIGPEKHVTTGYPRNDCLLEVPDAHRDMWSRYMNGLAARAVLYAPTWRNGRVPPRFFPFEDFDTSALTRLLEDVDACLLLRPHLQDLERYPQVRRTLEGLAQHERIRMATHSEFVSTNSLLPFVDVVISDYSSIYHDFLLLDRPMVFVPYDPDDMADQQGFLYDYFENLPGPAVYTFHEFCDELNAALTGEDRYSDRRAALTEKIHTYRDAESSRRVSELVTSTLHEA